MNQNMIKSDIQGILKERIGYVAADARLIMKARIDILNDDDPELGGGNLTVATMLFNSINFLGKVSYFMERPDRFEVGDCESVNETEVFVYFAKELHDSGLLIFPSTDGRDLQRIWKGFRNYLVHRLTVQTGKSVVHFEFPEDWQGRTLAETYTYFMTRPVITRNAQGAFDFYPDVLLAWIEEIQDFVINKVQQSSMDDKEYDKLYGILSTD